MKTGIYIGIKRKAIKEARQAILDIMKAGRGVQVTCKALETMRDVCSINGVSMSHCHVNGGKRR